MVIPLPAHKKRFTVHLNLKARQPVSLGIWVYDPRFPSTDYFRRKVSFREPGQREIKVPLPVTPDYLELEVFNKTNGSNRGFRVQDFTVKTMPPAELWASEERHRFMEFAIGFAQKSGYTRPGFYPSSDDEFLIQYLPVITDDLGNEQITPARIHRKMPRVQLSRQMFRNFSIPVRVAILAHEACHFFMNTRSEKEADLCGLRYYLDYGFPKIEAIYATTKVFSLYPESVGEAHLQRTRDMMDFIDSYQLRQVA